MQDPLPRWRSDDWIVFWGVSLVLLLIMLLATWWGEQDRGSLGRRCLPDGICERPGLVCREGRERGDWRCLPPRGVP